MKRIKIPSLASIRLDDFSRRIPPAGNCAVLLPLRLRESFSFLTYPPILFNPFNTVAASLHGYYHPGKDMRVFKESMFTKIWIQNTDWTDNNWYIYYR